LQLAVRILLVGLVLTGCTQESDRPEAPLPEAQSVVVFAAYEDKTYLPSLFNEFTQETGIVVIVRNGEVPGIIDDVIGSSSEPLADVLITPSANGVWRVAEEGELRPNYSAVVASNVPPWLKDSDNYWLALSYRQAVIVYDAAQFDAAELSTYEDLSTENFRRKLCLSSSDLDINRTVIAMLIQKLGKRNAELAVRGWVANLAQPPFASEASLVQAIARGECAVGIVASGASAGTSLQIHSPDPTYVAIEAVGVTRHARNPDAAVQLIDWMMSAGVQQQHAEQTGAFPVLPDAMGSHSVMQAAAGNAEATKLAERARYR
jgi:iron(III) transport system substrate-binding protein